MSSEKRDGREHIDRTTQYLVERGGLPPALAHQKAKEARIRAEKRGDGAEKREGGNR